MEAQQPGLFITFEGGDGAGKTTQLMRLKEALTVIGRQVCVTREPGGDAVAETVRHLLLTAEMDTRAELLLFLASRAQNTAQVIRPALEAGAVVLCDRFIDSSIAYQGYARGLGRDVVAQLNDFATGGLMPHLTILLDLPPEIGLARQQEANRMEAAGLAFQQRVREGYLAEAAHSPARFYVLDAHQSPEALHTQIWTRIQSLCV